MGWNKIFSTAVFVVLLQQASAQTAPNTYLVTFTDKAGSPYTLTHPEAYLSQRSIERRQRYHISIDQTDLPITPAYLNGLKSISGVTVVARSKWLNNATVMITDTAALSAIHALPYVLNVKSNMTCVRNTLRPVDKNMVNTEKGNTYFTTDSIDYGLMTNQIKMLNGQFLHQLGFSGQSMQVAVMDVGFGNVNVLPQFQPAFNDGRIRQVKDLVHRDGDVYNSGTHGTMVLSCMAADVSGQCIGTAPDATYYLFVTENDTSEYPVEEDYWVMAAEFADSIGVDVFNTSLGYTEFDDTTLNHTYADLDGNTTRITKGVDLAAKKGILSVNSAGNSGTSAWYYISAPADADSNLTVGAVGPDRVYAPFSSKGPTADGRIKPDVATQGYQSTVVDVLGTVIQANGTSFSGPTMCGMAACLWQAFPEKNNMEIIQAIKNSASDFDAPGNFTGSGIPDMQRAFYLLSNSYSSSHLKLTVLNNPFTDRCRILFSSTIDEEVRLDLYDFSGKKVTSEKIMLEANVPGFYTLDVADKLLPAGVYVVKVIDGNGPVTIKLVKQ